MEQRPLLTISGLRGIWGNTLNQEVTLKYIRAFVVFIKEESGKEKLTVLVGRDGRESGMEIKKVVLEENKFHTGSN